jgi:Domain of unknown function (DUF4781)
MSESVVRRGRLRVAVRSVVRAAVVTTVLAGLTPSGLLGSTPAKAAAVRAVAVVAPLAPFVVRPVPTDPAPGPGGGGGGGGNPAPSPGGHKDSSSSSGSGSSGGGSAPAPKPAAHKDSPSSGSGSGSNAAPKPSADKASSAPSNGGAQPGPKPATNNAPAVPSNDGAQPGPRPAADKAPAAPNGGSQPAAPAGPPGSPTGEAPANAAPAPAPGPRNEAATTAAGTQPTVAPAPGPNLAAARPGDSGPPTVAPAAPARPVPPGGPQLAADQTPLGARPPPGSPTDTLADRQAVGLLRPQTPEALSGATKLTTDPATAGVLRDYESTLPANARSGQLDFGSTPVAAPRWNALVGEEGGDVGKFNSMVHEVGGANPQVTQTLLVLRSDKGEFGTASLFQVKGADGKTTLVDGQGAKYTDMNDYLENNELDDSWTMVRPANPGAPAGQQGQLISGPAHNTTFSQRVDQFGVHVAGPAMVAGGALMVGASAVGEVGTVGLATPVAAPGAALGVGLIASGSAMIINGTGKDLFNRYQHGRSISPADPEARADYLNLAGVAGGVGGTAARAAGAAGLAAASDSAAVGAFGALTADQGTQSYNDWGSLTPQQRTERVAQLGTNAALLALPAAGRVAPEAVARSPESGSGAVVKHGPVPGATSREMPTSGGDAAVDPAGKPTNALVPSGSGQNLDQPTGSVTGDPKLGAPRSRFLANSAGGTLDTMRVAIPEGKFGYLLKNPSKAGVFHDSMGFDQPGLDAALRKHLVDNFGKSSPAVPMTGGGTKFTVRGPMAGPSGRTWDITTAWGVDPDGTVRLITATP